MDVSMSLFPRASSSNSSNSVSGLITTLIPNLILAAAFVGLFLVLRPKVKRIYAPRTYLGNFTETQKTPAVPTTRLGWIKPFREMPDEYVLSHHSLDAYLLLRYWRTLVAICLVGWPFTWIILMPIYGTSHAGQKEFDKISYSNIQSSTDSARLYGVWVVATIFLLGIMWMIARESFYALQIKQAFLKLPANASRLASRTVLFTNVPDEFLNEERMRQQFPAMRYLWIASDTKELDELVQDRDKTALKLEGAEVKLSANANKARLKAEKKGKPKPDAEAGGLQWLDEKKRPTHRLKMLIGKKVDTIDWSRTHLQELIPKVEKSQEFYKTGNPKYNSAVFVEFETVHDAAAAAGKIDVPKQFEARAIATRPSEVVWKNLNMGKAQRKTRNAVVVAFFIWMIIMWIPIVAFIGALTNINNLTNEVKFLSFINKIPSQILGIVTGLIPVVLLAVLMALVPIIMRLLFKLAGAASLAEIELKTQSYYFIFQVIQVFLVTTLASGASATVTKIIAKPASAANLLAVSLPKASNFYINYFVLYGLATASSQLFNIAAVVVYIVLGKLLDSTPRKKFNRYVKVAGIGWGSLYPVFTNLAVIAITYSCIAPLILAFAAISFFFVYIAFRYQMFFSVDTNPIDTQGRAFAKALQQLTTGVYLLQVCLIGLFAISTSASSVASGALALMIVTLVLTVLFHLATNRALATFDKTFAQHSPTKRQFSEDGEEMKSFDGNGQLVPDHYTPAPQGKLVTTFFRILYLPPLPAFADALSTPIAPYSEDDHKHAYLDPAISSPTPILWLAHDDMGISTREAEASGKVLETTQDGAWFEEKTGKLKTEWMGKDGEEEIEAVRRAPVFEELPKY